MQKQKCQVLLDRSASGRIRPWSVYKLANTYLSYAYSEVDEKKAERLRNCATALTYRKEGERMRLVHADFCRVRLCPVCQWRRSLKNYGQMQKILSAIEGQYKYIFLTLTVRNVSGSELSGTIDRMMSAWNRFTGYKQIEEVMKGWYRGLEVTHNVSTDEYHPHFHVLIAVNKSYFTSRKYVKQEQITELWKRALKAKYTPIVDVRKVNGNDAKAIAEVAKYAVKPGDIINYDDWDLTVDTVRVLDEALAGRRLVAFGGILKEWHKKLNLDDEETGDLLDIGHDDSIETQDEAEEVTFVWHTGYNQYIGK